MEYSLTFSSLSVDFLYPHYCLLKVKFSEVMREGGGGGGGVGVAEDINLVIYVIS